MTSQEKAFQEFSDFAAQLKGDEKSEAQTFLFHLLEAFGHDANTLPEGCTFEYRVRFPGDRTKFADLVWPGRVLIEMKSRGEKLSKHYQQTFDYWLNLVPHRPPFAGHAEVCRMMDDLFQKMNTMERHLHQMYWAHLHEVIEARKGWIQAEAFFRALVAIMVLKREMPEKLRPGFEKILADHSPGGFDAEKEYRETESEAVEAEAKFRKALAGLEVDWPERVDAALRERLEKVDQAGANDWQAQIKGEKKLADKAAAASI